MHFNRESKIDHIIVGQLIILEVDEIQHKKSNIILETVDNDSDKANCVFEEEWFLPRLLVKYGFFKSTSQLRKNRIDLWRELEENKFEIVRIGHNFIYILTGFRYINIGDDKIVYLDQGGLDLLNKKINEIRNQTAVLLL